MLFQKAYHYILLLNQIFYFSSNKLKSLSLKKTEDLTSATGRLADKISFSSSNTNLFASAIMAASGGIDKLTVNIAGKLIESFLSPEKSLNRFFNFLNKNLIQSSFEFDKNLSAINKSLGGMGKEFENVAMTTAGPFRASAVSGLAQYGVTLEDFGKSYGALNSKVNGFNQLSEQQRKLLASNAATMQTLGVSAETYASLTSTFMGSLGRSAENTNIAIQSLAKDAIAAGRNVAEYTREFEQLLPKLTIYAREATQIFKELNSLSAMTKGVVSASDLEKFADQFNTWDSATESVSKLNAALGGTSVSIHDMILADPSERLIMIKRAFDASGKSFDDMNRGFKTLLAEGFGGDMAKASAFFKGSLMEANDEMHKMQASEKELEERKQKSISAQEKLTKAIEGMKIALTPIVSIFSTIADIIIKLNEGMGGFGGFLAVGIPLGIMAVRGMMILTANTIKMSFGTIFAEISSGLQALSAQIAAVKQEAASTTTTTGGGGTPKASGVLGRMGGIGLITTLIGAAAIAESQAEKSRQERQQQGIKEINTNKFSSITQTSNYPAMPTVGAGDITTNKSLYTIDESTNQLTKIANIHPRDEATKVELATPEERAKQQNLMLTPLQDKIEKINSNLYSYNDRLVKETNSRSSNLVQEYASMQEKTLEKQEKMFSTAISQVSVRTKLELDRPIVATLREADANYIMNKSANMAAASQHRKDTVVDEVIGV